MNNGLNDEGKNVIKEVDNNSNFAENLTKFYNNKDLVDKNKNTTMMSDTVKLNKAEDTSEASNAIYDFVINLWKHIKKFVDPKKINTEEEYKERMAACRTITLIPAFFALFQFIDVHGIWSIISLILLVLCYYLFTKNQKTGIFVAIAASVVLILSFKLINIILGVFYLYGNILLLRYKKDS